MTGVRNREQNIQAGQNRRPSEGALLIHCHVMRFDGETAACGHGIARIHRKIHNDLLDLSRICLHSPKRLTRVEIERNIFANQAPQ